MVFVETATIGVQIKRLRYQRDAALPFLSVLCVLCGTNVVLLPCFSPPTIEKPRRSIYANKPTISCLSLAFFASFAVEMLCFSPHDRRQPLSDDLVLADQVEGQLCVALGVAVADQQVRIAPNALGA